jgi:hypothetical protein
LIEWHPLPFSQGGSIADWQASGQGLAAVRDVSVAEVAFGSMLLKKWLVIIDES